MCEVHIWNPILDNINYANNDNLIQDESKDFVSGIYEEEELQIHKDLRKRKYTLIGLGSVYFFLILVSITLLT